MRRMIALGAACSALLLVSACDDDDDGGTQPVAGTGTLVVQFDHVVGAEDLALNTGTYTNAAGNTYSVSLLEYVVSELELEVPTGELRHENLAYDGWHYRNADDETTRALTFTDVPVGEYAYLKFRFGLDGEGNTTGAYPDLDLLGMAWPAMMGGGYHYMRHEGAFTPDGGGTGNFTTHLGPSLGNDYSFEVELDLDTGTAFTLGTDETAVITVAMDLNEWYTDPNPYDFDDYGPIMGNPTAQELLEANGHSVFSISSIAVSVP